MEAIKKDELFDDALCGIVKFTDATVKPQKPAESKKKSESKLNGEEKKTAYTGTKRPVKAEYEPVETWYDEKTGNLVKWVLLFICLEYLIFYWQYKNLTAVHHWSAYTMRHWLLPIKNRRSQPLHSHSSERLLCLG